jgi:hypothetical protein
MKIFIWVFLSACATALMFDRHLSRDRWQDVALVAVVVGIILWPVYSWLVKDVDTVEALKPLIDELDLDELEELDDYIDAKLLK